MSHVDLSGVNVVDLVKALGLSEEPRMVSGGQEIRFPCFGPEHSDGGAAYINVETTAWICHGCHRRGNAVGLVQGVQNVTRSQAEFWLRERYGIEVGAPIGGSMMAEIEMRLRPALEPVPRVLPPESWLASCRYDWACKSREPFQDYMLGRGFSPDILAACGIGYDFMSDRITIPVRAIDGELVGIKGRAWEEGVQPKYRVLGDVGEMTRFGFDVYDPRDVVYGLEHNRDVKTVVVCEGELNRVALLQLGVERPVALGMSYFSPRHAELLVREAGEAVLYFDRDLAGYNAVHGQTGSDGRHTPGGVELLRDHVRVRVADPLPEDPSKLLELGRGDQALECIRTARSYVALAYPTVFV